MPFPFYICMYVYAISFLYMYVCTQKDRQCAVPLIINPPVAFW